MRKVRIVLIAAAVTGLMAGIAGEAVGGSAQSAGKATVKLGDDFFSPDEKKVAKGTLVRFKWIGSNPHNVTKVKGPGGDFHSKTTSKPGINFKKRFKKKGIYDLICTIHSGMDMELKVK